jgi:probable addiction module antidote protein
MVMAPYDSAELHQTPEAIQHYIDEALATGDPSFIAHTLGTIARAKGMTNIARKTGLARESLYRGLSADGHPAFATVLKVLAALDLDLSTKRRLKRKATKAAPARPKNKLPHSHSAKRAKVLV